MSNVDCQRTGQFEVSREFMEAMRYIGVRDWTRLSTRIPSSLKDFSMLDLVGVSRGSYSSIATQLLFCWLFQFHDEISN